MKFSSTLQSATLIKRYKRFLADIELPNGEIRTIHCANTGAMTGCAETGFKVHYSTSDNLKRKYPNSLELCQNEKGDMICVNTSLANKIVSEGIVDKVIPELRHYQTIQQEVKYGDENSRIDLLLTDENHVDCYIEIKSVTLLKQNEQGDGQGYFPDAVTTRGLKHLRELISMKQQGHRAVLLFLVQHQGIKKLSPARHVDAKYADGIQHALDAGVEILCYNTYIDVNMIVLNQPLPFLPL
ncbi:DNA/RNA nuclease SfsA [Pseudoalteromonas denitrificans]|uniref:Sugar fermentation stimulation protein homolog n=1 Tax=Pseudoalteromonas denitrificans DSM 6059 TaxID=1123010 RepID=A0A1I1E3N8_9GAMM|nr:DNA/RNA nuclease SfsA [Pseudoalteromonas denitrificans]SFB81724.1 sugar fermentation stimulation protein A [Pseudoalteromonas denitrificans DSM 6059]